MERPCAYCKEFGHHIRYCSVLKNKNKIQDARAMRIVPTPVRKVIVKTNMFATIYNSSDDEIEDGEVFEEDRIIEVSDESEDEDEIEIPVPVENWTRSRMTVQKPVMQKVTIEREIPVEFDDDYIIKFIEEINVEWEPIIRKCTGRSWAEISYDTDCE